MSGRIIRANQKLKEVRMTTISDSLATINQKY